VRRDGLGLTQEQEESTRATLEERAVDYQRYHEENHLRIEIADRVAIVTLDRPDKRNAIDYRLHEGLESALPELGVDPDVGAIVLTGAGSAFCAGGDLVGSRPPDREGPLHTFRNRDLNWAIARCEAPLIAAVNGTAAGLGATLALMCDVIFMADTAKIGDTHPAVALVAGDGGQAIWPLLVGPHRAKEYLMAGELISAAEAERIGLVNHVVPAAEVMPRALAYARKLADGAQCAIRWTKLAVNKLILQQLNLTLEVGLATELMSVKTEDAQEAFAAFREKRKPMFRGR
jgi:enoyl-CoA hydratase/carnithine racemase